MTDYTLAELLAAELVDMNRCEKVAFRSLLKRNLPLWIAWAGKQARAHPAAERRPRVKRERMRVE